MIEEGALLNPRVDAVVGLHISQSDVVGRASLRPLGLMASAQRFDVEISDSQTHGARPWAAGRSACGWGVNRQRAANHCQSSD